MHGCVRCAKERQAKEAAGLFLTSGDLKTLPNDHMRAP